MTGFTQGIFIHGRHPSGYLLSLQVDALDGVEAAVAELSARGWRPTGEAGDGWARTPEGLPLCPKHRAVMRAREKQGDTWHSHSVLDHTTGEVAYCRGYAGASSPGWALAGGGEA